MTLTQRLKKLAKLEASPYLRGPDYTHVQVRIYPAQGDFETHGVWFATCRVASRVPIVDTQPQPTADCRDIYRFNAAQNVWAFTERVAR